jgi:hypothetical protein
MNRARFFQGSNPVFYNENSEFTKNEKFIVMPTNHNNILGTRSCIKCIVIGIRFPYFLYQKEATGGRAKLKGQYSEI